MSIKINSIDKTFVYIDPSRQYTDNPAPEDGLTPATSLYNLPSQLRSDAIYLIRKTYAHYAAKLLATINDTTTTSLTIWGMPNNGEKHWDEIPEIARTAWGDDSQLNYKSSLYIPGYGNGQLYINFTNLKYLELYNFRFMDGNSQQSSSYYCFNITNDTACDVRLENMEFVGVKFENNEYHRYHETSSYNNYMGSKWIFANNGNYTANSCIIKNCTFDTLGSYYGINLGYCRNVEISNVLINVVATNNSSSDNSGTCIRIAGRRNNVRIISNAHIRDLAVRLYYNTKNQGSNYYYHRFNNTLYVEDMVLDIKDVDIRFADDQYGTLPQGTNIVHQMSFSGADSSKNALIYARVFQGSRVEHVVADMGNYLDLANNSVLNIEYAATASGSDVYSYGENRFGQYVIVKDITINCDNITSKDPATGEVLTSVGSIGEHADELMRTGLNSSYNYTKSALVVRKTTNSSMYRSSDDILLQNINITAYRGFALIATGCMLDMADRDIYGLVRLSGCVGKIHSITSYAVQKALADNGSNLIYINSINCNRNLPGAEYTNQPAVAFGLGGSDSPTMEESAYLNSNILITKSNTKCFNTTPYNCAYECLYVCTNNQNDGNYTCRNGATFCQTWSVYRTGSDNQCSLKLENGSYNHADTPLNIGGSPFKGITKHVAQGNHMIKLYVTTYGYNNPEEIKNHLFLRVRRADGRILTDFEGNWSQDTVSEWNNIDNGSAFVLEVPISITEADGEDLEFQYSFNWYYGDAATFVDPYPVIEAIA